MHKLIGRVGELFGWQGQPRMEYKAANTVAASGGKKKKQGANGTINEPFRQSAIHLLICLLRYPNLDNCAVRLASRLILRNS